MTDACLKDIIHSGFSQIKLLFLYFADWWDSELVENKTLTLKEFTFSLFVKFYLTEGFLYSQCTFDLYKLPNISLQL